MINTFLCEWEIFEGEKKIDEMTIFVFIFSMEDKLSQSLNLKIFF